MANKLIDEQSPYLLQHAFNPVDWRPWGDEAFLKAKTENKPLLVSIGYSACHWCHVMEHESFEDDDVAAYMNEHFVCIKVDREEHPDVDHLYMDAVQAIAGNGGWPLNVFVTPDRAPFYGGTYYPPRPAYNRPSWMQILNRMNEIWQNQRGEAEQQAGQLVAHLRQASAKGASAAAPRGAGFCREIADNLLKQADKEMGGFGNAPKFPGTMAIIFLLEHYRFTGYEPALKNALRSLDAMIDGGIYDQLAGGFARYATDRNWLVPHFEKMLYDNALVVSALCDAYSITKDLRYKIIIEETINFIETELKDKSGGYYCALDADSEGVEGKFYTWTWQEWTAALGGNDPVPAQYFGVRPEGNWEGTNILHVAATMEDVARQDCITVTEAKQRIDAAKRKLLAARRYRLRPGTDDKSLLSWNALMNITLTKAGVCLGPGAGDKYIDRAGAHMEWMMAAYNGPDGLLHAWKDGKAKIPAKLDDYAYLMQAMLQLASASGENNWVLQANALMETITKDFAHGAGFGSPLVCWRSRLFRWQSSFLRRLCCIPDCWRSPRSTSVKATRCWSSRPTDTRYSLTPAVRSAAIPPSPTAGTSEKRLSHLICGRGAFAVSTLCCSPTRTPTTWAECLPSCETCARANFYSASSPETRPACKHYSPRRTLWTSPSIISTPARPSPGAICRQPYSRPNLSTPIPEFL